MTNHHPSRIQHPLAAVAHAVEFIQPALVQAVLRAVPELDAVGPHAQSGPAWRARDLTAFELALQFDHAPFELLALTERLRLLRRPCTELAAARARREIRVR